MHLQRTFLSYFCLFSFCFFSFYLIKEAKFLFLYSRMKWKNGGGLESVYLIKNEILNRSRAYNYFKFYRETRDLYVCLSLRS